MNIFRMFIIFTPLIAVENSSFGRLVSIRLPPFLSWTLKRSNEKVTDLTPDRPRRIANIPRETFGTSSNDRRDRYFD